MNAKKGIRFLAAVALLTAAAAAAPGQSVTFDIGTFTPPPGWQEQRSDDHLTYTWVDRTAGTFCMFAVYASQPAVERPDAGFASEWQALVAASFESPAAPQPEQAAAPSGLPLLTGAALVSREGTPYAVLLAVLQAGPRIQSVLAVAPSGDVLQQYQPQLEAFIGSFRFPSQPGSAPPAASVPPAPKGSPAGAPASALAAAADLGSLKGKGITGVWMGFKTVMGKYEPEPRWVTFYDDGQVLKDIPLEGLDGFDRGASKADPHQAPYWATYSWDGKAGSIVTPGVRSPTVIKAKSAGQIYLDSDVYYRCVEVDGLRLQGSWTTFSDPNDPVLDQREPGKKPVVTFNRDGTFVDEGIFASFFDASTGADPAQGRAGAGTYELRRFSVILLYADGRTRKLAITGVFGKTPSPSAEIIYLSRSRFNLRK